MHSRVRGSRAPWNEVQSRVRLEVLGRQASRGAGKPRGLQKRLMISKGQSHAVSLFLSTLRGWQILCFRPMHVFYVLVGALR